MNVEWALTQQGAGRRPEGLALQAAALQEVRVGGARVPGEAAAPVQRAQVQEHGALVVAHKVRLTCRRPTPAVSARPRACACACVCARVH